MQLYQNFLSVLLLYISAFQVSLHFSSLFQPLNKPIKIYIFRILYTHHACGPKTSISRIEDNFSRLTHKSGQIILKNMMTLCPFLGSNAIKAR